MECWVDRQSGGKVGRVGDWMEDWNMVYQYAIWRLDIISAVLVDGR